MITVTGIQCTGGYASVHVGKHHTGIVFPDGTRKAVPTDANTQAKRAEFMIALAAMLKDTKALDSAG